MSDSSKSGYEAPSVEQLDTENAPVEVVAGTDSSTS